MLKRVGIILITGGTICLSPALVRAGGNIVANGSFEGPTFIYHPDPSVTEVLPTGWFNQPTSPGSLSKLNVQSGGSPGAEDGANYMSFQSPSTNGSRDCFTQDLNTIAGQQYTISFWLAATATDANSVFSPTWDEGTANATTLNTGQFANPGVSGLIPYQHFSFIENASGSTTRIDFHGVDAAGAILLDNVVVAATPEPSALGGLMIGGIAMLRPRRLA